MKRVSKVGNAKKSWKRSTCSALLHTLSREQQKHPLITRKNILEVRNLVNGTDSNKVDCLKVAQCKI